MPSCAIHQPKYLKGSEKSFGFSSIFLPFFFRLNARAMSLKEQELYEFGKFRLDVTEHYLERISGKRVQLSEKAFETLCILVRNAGHLLNKEDLLNQVWCDSFVEENNLDKCIYAIRKALGEKPGEQKFVETVRKHGYRFVAEVRRVTDETISTHEEKAIHPKIKGVSSPKFPPIIGHSETKTSGKVIALAAWRHEVDKKNSEETTPEMSSNDSLQIPESIPAKPFFRNKRNYYFYFFAGFILFIALSIITFFFNSWFTRSRTVNTDAPSLSTSYSSEKLSTNGKVVHAIISPDGKNVIYTNGIKGKQSIWLRQLESAANVEIIPPSDNVYGGLAFSPDGNSFYFTRRPRNVEGQLDIYRVSIFGGIPTKIINDTQGWISISPDGGKISFVRCYYLENESCSLWIAGTDGSNERKLVSRQSPFRIGDNKISPDGKTVAFAAGQSENAANEFSLNVVDIESGAEHELTAQKFFDIKNLQWLPNQSNLLITAIRNPNKNFFIWQVSVVTGEASPLTKDSEDYSDLKLSKTPDLIVATQTKPDFKLVLYKKENLQDKRILADARHVGFTPAGKIIFSSIMSGNSEIWSINADGSEQRQLTNDAASDSAPVSSSDGNSIFFVSNRTGKAQIWRMNADGSNQKQITDKEGGYPLFASPDGRWIYYHHGLRRTLWRVSTNGGEDEQLVLDKEKYNFAFSPDGSQVAFNERQAEKTSIVIVSLTDGKMLKTFDYADKYSDAGIGLSGIAWLADGKSLMYILADNELDNNTLWLQPLDGKTPHKIADLGPESISSFALSPDGKSFAVVQGSVKHDAVLIKGLR